MKRWFVEFFWMTETNGLKFEKKVFKTWEEAQGFKHILNCDERVQDIEIIKVDGFKYIK